MTPDGPVDVLGAPVLEHVLLPVRPEDAEAFEAVFATSGPRDHAPS